MRSLRRTERVFYGWWIVLACAIIHLYSAGTFFYGFTAFFNPIVEEFGWSYALVSLAVSFRGFESGLLTPVVGILVDRMGSKKLLFAGTIVMGLGFLLLNKVHGLWSFYVVFLILSLGLTLASPVVTMTVVIRWFRQRRTLALGFLTTGFGAGGLLIPGVVWLIDRSGWRTTVILFGLGMWLLGLPLAWMVREPKTGEHDTEINGEYQEANPKPEGLTAREVLKTKIFWFLAIAVLLGGVAGTAVIVHQIPYMVSVGLSRQTAGLMAIVFAVSNVMGRLIFGWLGDVFDKRRVFAIAAATKAAGVLAFALSTKVGEFIPSLIPLGIGFGGLVPLRPALQGEFFGTRAFGTVQGLLMVFLTVGSVVSPPFAGWMFDAAGSYRPAFIVLALTTLMAVPAILAVPRKPSQVRAP